MNNVFYLERTSGGSNQVSLKSKLFERRVIYLDTPIDGESVNTTIQQIALLAADGPGEPMTMLINSPGGNIQDGLALIDVMQACEGPIQTVSLGMAASMAAIILAAGTPGHRFITRHSRVMLHQPLISGGLPGGNCSEIESVANSLIERKRQLDKLLIYLTGRPKGEIQKLTAKDTYLDAAQALKHGLVDKMVEGTALSELIGGVAI